VNSVSTPPVVILPILSAVYSVNQSAPSGPAVMATPPLLEVGIEYSVMTPAVVIRPTLLPPCSMN